LLQVWFAEQFVASLSVVLSVQEELVVPALLHVYVLYVLYTFPFLQKAEPISPDVPHWLFELQVMFEHDPFEQACPVEHVCFNLAVAILEQLELTVPGLLHVYVL